MVAVRFARALAPASDWRSPAENVAVLLKLPAVLPALKVAVYDCEAIPSIPPTKTWPGLLIDPLPIVGVAWTCNAEAGELAVLVTPTVADRPVAPTIAVKLSPAVTVALPTAWLSTV